MTRLAELQMVGILRKPNAPPVIEVAKKDGISDQTIYIWHKRLGELEAVDVKRLRHLEQENTKLNPLNPLLLSGPEKRGGYTRG